MTARLDQRNADRLCIVVDCTREVAVDDRSYCAMHNFYLRVFLADPWWRDHEPPEPEAPQMPLDVAYLRREPGRKGRTS